MRGFLEDDQAIDKDQQRINLFIAISKMPYQLIEIAKFTYKVDYIPEPEKSFKQLLHEAKSENEIVNSITTLQRFK